VLVHYVGKPVQQDAIGPRILKADLHGAYIRVQDSRSPTHIGLSGIILMELRNAFKVISKTNRVLLLPKAGSVFVLRTCGFLVTLYGSQLCQRSVDRSVAKFKSTASIDVHYP
jgi:ribonuclease P protein subunit POP4